MKINNKIKPLEWVFVLLPLVLWPISFILLKSIFIYAMLSSTFILAVFSIAMYKKKIPWNRIGNYILVIMMGIFGAFILYLLFFAGFLGVSALGLNNSVSSVYQMIYGGISNKYALFIMLALIAIFEEIYWRGALQSFMEKHLRALSKMPFIPCSIYYALVHLSTLNIVLVGAAFVVGLVTSVLAYRYGIIASIITHIIWIEAIVIFLPL